MAETTDEQLNKPGDLKVDELFITLSNGENYDLLPFFVELNLYEDVWNVFLSGNVILKDGVNLIGSGPIAGGEGITMKLRTPTYDDIPENVIDKTFQIFAIKDRSLNNDREQIYILHFISIEGMNDQGVVLSKRFQGNTAEIAEKIYADYVVESRRPLEGTEPTKMVVGDLPHASKVNFLANLWTPVQTLQFLSKYCKGNKHIGADFIFFESNKMFYYSSMQNLIEAQKDLLFDEYIYSPPGMDLPHREGGETYTGVKLPKTFVTIDSIQVPRTIDIINGQDSGYYSQSVRAYDLFTKERVEAKLDVREDFDKFAHTDPGIPIPEGIQRNPFAMTTIKVLNSVNNMTQAFNLPGSASGNSDNENIIGASLYRDNYFNSFKDYTFEIQTPGRTDIEVGRMIMLQYPSPITKTEDVDPDELFDRQLSGKYLITAIRHKIDTVAHTMRMEIVKNGLPESMGEPENNE